MTFWKDKKVFITGHTGFKGSWLTLWLKSLGAKIHGFSLAAEPLSLFNVANVHEGITSTLCDITTPGELQKSINSFEPEIIFHLAAQALVRPSFSDPLTTLNTNIMGTANLLEAARISNAIKAIVVITSDKCYENKEWFWPYREDDRLGGKDPYSASKACAELITHCYRQSFFQNTFPKVATVRAGNVIGGGDWSKDRLIPDLLKAYESNKPAVIRNPTAIRPWQHVCEPLSGYLTLAERLCNKNGKKFDQAWNFGPENASNKTVRWIADQMQNELNIYSLWQTDSAKNPHEAQLLKLDNSKAKERLGWQPQLNVKLALQWTAKWHKAYLNKQNMKSFTLKQILNYCAMLGKN